MKKLYKIGGFAVAILMATTILVPANTSAQTTTNMCSGLVRDLTLGSTGSDVVVLQTFLEQKGYLTIPVGVSKGYFGALTRSAVSRYQMARAIYPTVGYFGPLTRGKLVAECATTVPTPTPAPGNGGGLSGGEASLEQFDISSGDDSNVEEGSTAEIAEIEFDVEDGDIMIDRIDLRLVADSGNEEEDPWDTFDSVRLLVDGKEIAEADLSDEDEYLDEDEGTFRLSNINFKVDEGETVNIVVELTAQNSVDGADNNTSNWTINVEDDGIRATDAEGIQQYVGSDSDTVSFEIDEEGAGEELNVSSSNDDIDPDTFIVEDDAKSGTFSIFAFDLESEESDIEIDTIQIQLESDVNVANLISDLVLEIDGEEFDDWAFVGTGSTVRTVEFDIDGDFTIDADSEVTVVLNAEFKAANGTNYSSGATIQASISSGAVEGEGSDDVSSDGSATGDVHTLATEGLTVDLSSKDAESTGTDDKVGEFTFVIDVNAFEADAFVELAATRGTATADTGFNVLILDGNNTVVTTGVTTFSVEADENETSNDRVEVSENDTVQFTVTVFFDAATAGAYKAQLYSVNHNSTDADEDTQFVLSPASTYRTASTYVEN